MQANANRWKKQNKRRRATAARYGGEDTWQEMATARGTARTDAACTVHEEKVKWGRTVEEKQIKGIIIIIIIKEHASKCKQMKKTNGEARLQHATEERTSGKKWQAARGTTRTDTACTVHEEKVKGGKMVTEKQKIGAVVKAHFLVKSSMHFSKRCVHYCSRSPVLHCKCNGFGCLLSSKKFKIAINSTEKSVFTQVKY